jgi:two-component system OmpR family sensor kinase
LVFIFFHYDRIEKEHLRNDLFLEMKNYAFSFNDKRFDIDIVPRHEKSRFFELLEDNSSLYLLTPFPDDQENALKIYLPKKTYETQHGLLHIKLLKQFLLLSLIALFISILFSFYVLRPLRESLSLLEGFTKDIIHDLNTPLSSILINLKMIDSHSEEIQSINRSARTISMLHHNLHSYIEEKKRNTERFDIREVVMEQIDFFRPMYAHLSWEIDLAAMILHSDRAAFARILYNLISNACKYNTREGYIRIRMEGSHLMISNPSYGIKHPDRLFERFYKEHERGLGIGLHIVEKLCRTLHISKELQVSGKEVTIILDLSALPAYSK